MEERESKLVMLFSDLYMYVLVHTHTLTHAHKLTVKQMMQYFINHNHHTQSFSPLLAFGHVPLSQ